MINPLLFLSWDLSDSVSDSLALMLDSVFPVRPFLVYRAVREFQECLAFFTFKKKKSFYFHKPSREIK